MGKPSFFMGKSSLCVPPNTQTIGPIGLMGVIFIAGRIKEGDLQGLPTDFIRFPCAAPSTLTWLLTKPGAGNRQN